MADYTNSLRMGHILYDSSAIVAVEQNSGRWMLLGHVSSIMVKDLGVSFVFGTWNSVQKSSAVDEILNAFGKGSRVLLKIVSLCYSLGKL